MATHTGVVFTAMRRKHSATSSITNLAVLTYSTLATTNLGPIQVGNKPTLSLRMTRACRLRFVKVTGRRVSLAATGSST